MQQQSGIDATETSVKVPEEAPFPQDQQQQPRNHDDEEPSLSVLERALLPEERESLKRKRGIIPLEDLFKSTKKRKRGFWNIYDGLNVNNYKKRLKRVKEIYNGHLKTQLERDPSSHGNWIVFYKGRVYGLDNAFRHASEALAQFQTEIDVAHNPLNDVYYLTCIGNGVDDGAAAAEERKDEGSSPNPDAVKMED